MADARVLVAGIGNVFLGDDAFGVEVAQLLLRRQSLPAEVKVVDYGIRGYDVAYEMLNDYEATVLIDATSRGDAAGTVYVIEPDLDSDLPNPDDMPDHGQGAFQGHAMTPAAVFTLVRTLGGTPRRVLIVGCEPESLGDETIGQMGLTETVERAVPTGADTVEHLVRDVLTSTVTTREAVPHA
ncbi:MAG: hydrogenase maturation protease [Candidatus Dormibacteria bacterium]